MKGCWLCLSECLDFLKDTAKTLWSKFNPLTIMIIPTIAHNAREIINGISLGPTDPSEKGPVAVVIIVDHLKAVITGSYTEDAPDIVSKTETLESTPKLRGLLDALMVDGTTFVTETNAEENCRLKWQMTASAV